MQDEEYMRQLSFGNGSALDPLVFRYHKPLEDKTDFDMEKALQLYDGESSL